MGNCVSRKTILCNHYSTSDSSSDGFQDSTAVVYTPKQKFGSITQVSTPQMRNGTSEHWCNETADKQKHMLIPRASAIDDGNDQENTHSSQDPPINSNSFTFLNGGYWPSWKDDENGGTSCVQVDSITHVHYAFANLSNDGTVYFADTKISNEVVHGVENECLRKWMQYKKKTPSLRVTLSVGGGSDTVAKTFADVCLSPQKRFVFARSLKAIVEKFGLDGIDIDWEIPNKGVEARSYLQLLTELRQTLGWHRWLSVALPASHWVLTAIDLPRIAKIVDFINLMAYDFVGPDFAHVHRTGHHAQLYTPNHHHKGSGSTSTASAVEYMISRGVASRKIMLGVPTYGRCFKGALVAGAPFQGSGSGIDATYEVKHLPRPGMVEHFDPLAVAAYAAGNDEFITYDNNESVRKKAEFVVQKNLRGLFYWHLAGDRSGDDSLVKAGYKVFMGSTSGNVA